jgi:hypothetical protein
MIVTQDSARALTALRRSNFARPLRSFLEAELYRRRLTNEMLETDPKHQAAVHAAKDLIDMLFDASLELPR